MYTSDNKNKYNSKDILTHSVDEIKVLLGCAADWLINYKYLDHMNISAYMKQIAYTVQFEQ